MDIKLECVELLMCECVRLCVVHKLPTDKSPQRGVRAGLFKAGLGESGVEMCTFQCVGFSLNIFEGKRSRHTVEDLISISSKGQYFW